MLEFLAAGTAAAEPPFWISMLPIVGMVAIFWFLIIRPQMRQQKLHREIAQGVRVKAVKTTLGDIVPPGGKPAND